MTRKVLTEEQWGEFQNRFAFITEGWNNSRLPQVVFAGQYVIFSTIYPKMPFRDVPAHMRDGLKKLWDDGETVIKDNTVLIVPELAWDNEKFPLWEYPNNANVCASLRCEETWDEMRAGAQRGYRGKIIYNMTVAVDRKVGAYAFPIVKEYGDGAWSYTCSPTVPKLFSYYPRHLSLPVYIDGVWCKAVELGSVSEKCMRGVVSVVAQSQRCTMIKIGKTPDGMQALVSQFGQIRPISQYEPCHYIMGYLETYKKISVSEIVFMAVEKFKGEAYAFELPNKTYRVVIY